MKQQPTQLDYVYLRAWDNMMHSAPYWTDRQLALARKENAPKNAVYRNSSGKWITFDSVSSPITRTLITERVRELGGADA